MANALDNLTGRVFGLLTVVERAPNDKFGTVYWRCVCRCGETKLVRANQLRAGKFFTCGKLACRFWEKVYIPEDPDACWEWTGALHTGGYGVLKVGSEVCRAHVFAFEQQYGSVPDGLFVLHKCDNRKCVRGEHLYSGTAADNARDMVARGRSHAPRLHVDMLARRGIKVAYSNGGVSQEALAVEYGVSVKTIQRILKETLTKE